jgi:hypothetical protein
MELVISEDKHIVDNPIDEMKNEPDKPCKTTTKAVRASKRLKKPPSIKEKRFLW